MTTEQYLVECGWFITDRNKGLWNKPGCRELWPEEPSYRNWTTAEAERRQLDLDDQRLDYVLSRRGRP